MVVLYGSMIIFRQCILLLLLLLLQHIVMQIYGDDDMIRKTLPSRILKVFIILKKFIVGVFYLFR